MATNLELVTCQDVKPDCADYTSSVCRDHPDWSLNNCPNFCGRCHEGKLQAFINKTSDCLIDEKGGTIPKLLKKDRLLYFGLF